MLKQVLLDNDVVLKIACYSLAEEVLATTTINGVQPGMLGVGKFVVRGRLDRALYITDIARAKAAFDHLLCAVSLLEPADEELAMAADLEAEANRHNLELDGGESQLLAILANRECPLFITGDKRAVVAMATVAPSVAAGRVGCLEQLVVELVKTAGVGLIRTRVCAEPQADRAMAICFGCLRATADLEEVLDGLRSYIGHLDHSAPGILLSGIGLNSLVASPS